ncbi:putative extracellular lipase [Microthyrium microscopicum]|uniref:Putative extracellular lipase n=1 Tax=Microthyrium microscopicum TaxID=703497 RepID=A0A6A6UR26_9PEZI|nr:putative extracellular lipase [Microthyrium microscopicum]
MTPTTILLSIFAGLAYAGPLLRRATAISAQAYSEIELVEQWAAASYCPANDNGTAGAEITCSVGNCPLVDTANTAIVIGVPTTTQADTACFVALDHTNKKIVNSYRGTESFRNYLIDADLSMTDLSAICTGCRGFKGMYRGWTDVASVTLAAIKSAKQSYPDYTVTVTGHSLGGGIATFATTIIRNAGIAADMVTFGAPRVGNEAYVNYTMAQTPALGTNYRVTHTLDPVPNEPSLNSGYLHISPSYFITAVGTAAVGPTDVEYVVGTDVEYESGSTSTEQTVAHDNYMGLPISTCYPVNPDGSIPYSVGGGF